MKPYLLFCVKHIVSGCNLQVLPCFLLAAVASKKKLAKLGKKSPKTTPPPKQLQDFLLWATCHAAAGTLGTQLVGPETDLALQPPPILRET